MQPPEGAPFHITGDFREIQPPRRLVYTFEYEEPDPDDQETLVTLSFAGCCRGNAACSRPRAVRNQGPDGALHETGWAETLDGLERFLALTMGTRLRIGGTAMTVESDAWRGERMKKTVLRFDTRRARRSTDRSATCLARLADLDGYRTWMHRRGLFRRSDQTSDGPRGLGTAYFDATRWAPSAVTSRSTSRRRGSIPRDSAVVRLRPDGGETRVPPRSGPTRTIVLHIAEGELFGLMRLMKPVAALLARSERDANHQVVEAFAGVGDDPQQAG